MSKKKQNRVPSIISETKIEETGTSKKHQWWSRLSGLERLAAVGVGLLLTVGAFGVTGLGVRIIETLTGRTTGENSGSPNFSQSSTLNAPLASSSTVTSTPQLSKEYVYAGSRMLAVEDANASAAPPADLAVWRPSTGIWYVLGGPGSQQTYFQWGGTGDVTVPGDYDGDGKTDFSVFRPTNGYWYIARSSDGSSFGYAFGQSGDRVAQADYDGDGKTDAAVYRNGWWYIQRSSDAGYISHNFGLSTDTPAPADYDGDGKADLAIWRPSDATFYTRLSSTNFTTNETASFPQTSTQPVSGDYDGDGKADYAIRYNDTWIIKYSSTGQMQPALTWQSGGNVAVQNDYDGDGKVDIAVWSNSNGNWSIRQSSLGGQLRQVAWGQTSDIPVPAFYRR